MQAIMSEHEAVIYAVEVNHKAQGIHGVLGAHGNKVQLLNTQEHVIARRVAEANRNL